MDFGIFSPKLGKRTDMPSALIGPAFLGEDTSNVHKIDGLYKTIPGRLPHMYDDNNSQVAAPKYVYAITAVSTGDKKFTIAGNHASEVPATLRVMSSTGNDRLYTKVSATDVDATTEIVVSETVADATVDGNVFLDVTPVLAYYKHTRDSTGSDYLLIATAYHIWLWSHTDTTLTVKFTCSAACSTWSIDSLDDVIYATNDLDPIQTYDIGASVSGSFTDLVGSSGLDCGSDVYVTKAKFLTAWEGTLIIAGTTEDGYYKPRRVRACDGADTETWESTATNDAFVRDCNETSGHITGLAKYSALLVVMKTDKPILGQLNGTDTVVSWDTNSLDVGTKSPGSIVNDKAGNLYFLSDDKKLRELNTAEELVPQASQLLQTINVAALDKVKASYVSYFGTNIIMLAVPTGDATENDLLIEVDSDNGLYYTHDIPVSAFGEYTQQEVYTFASLPYDTYAAWGDAWGTYNSNVNEVGTHLDLVADSSGYTYELFRSSQDNGEDITSVLDIHTSLSQTPSLNVYKNLSDRIEVWINTQSSGTITLSVLLDGSTSEITLGSASMVESGQNWKVLTYPVHLRFRHARFKVTTTAQLEFIGIMFKGFDYDGSS